MNYAKFLDSKRVTVEPSGFQVSPSAIHPTLFPFQRDITAWALNRGKAALFEDCGLGKTFQQTEWARLVTEETHGNALILAPLAVSKQTDREAAKLDIEVHLCKTADDVKPGINIANYERLHHFDPTQFSGLVLDESSILKAFSGVTRKEITEFAKAIPYRLACTATPAPNDYMELLNHAVFLDIMSGNEIRALFFTQDGNSTNKWKLKGHAQEEFWRWMASWSVALRKPSDLGYSDEGFVLPPLEVQRHVVTPTAPTGGALFHMEALSLQERRQARRESLTERVGMASDIINASTEPFVVWCDLNTESEALADLIPDAVEIRGSNDPDFKEQAMLDFADGQTRVLVTKPSIAGFGMNWQHCANVVFVGLSDSYEQYYQAVRRCWRFGQTKPVNVHIITAETEGAVVENIIRKERQSNKLFENVVKHMKVKTDLTVQSKREEMRYQTESTAGEGWTLHLGDSVEVIEQIEDDSVGLSVFSPPFPGMYAYTNSPRDMGNVKDVAEMIEHFRFLMGRQMLRVTMPGRSCAIHVRNIPAMKSRHGYKGLIDFRGEVRRMMEEEGWIFASETTIGTNPQVEAVRTKEQGLLFKTLSTDASLMRMGLADYLLRFYKPGENTVPIEAGISEKYNPGGGWVTESEWIEWASPIWPAYSKAFPHGIRQTNVLNVAVARDSEDERHLCPLQLDVIERAIKLWSAPGDLVFSPFAGIGSEGHVALQLGRRFVGVELKESYYRTACNNLRKAEGLRATDDLFSLIPEGVQS